MTSSGARDLLILSPYRTGIILLSISAIIWSTVGLFAKGIHVDVWTILFWRGTFSILALGAYVVMRREKGLAHEFANMGWPGWISALVGAAATICFISAFKYTSIANVSIIYAISPFIVTILVWILIREKSSGRTLMAAAIALAGVSVMVGGSLGSIKDQTVGDLIEALGEQTGKENSTRSAPMSDMAFARTCYDHLAGWLGVRLTESLVARGHVIQEGNSFELTEQGVGFLRNLGIDLDDARKARRVFARACQDWTEGEAHIGGALGAELCGFLQRQKWIDNNEDYREVYVLDKGRRKFEAVFGIQLE